MAVGLLLFPLSFKATRTQLLMRSFEPELARIKKEFPSDRQAQARKTMELYREKKVNPFSTFLFMFIQIFFIIALFFVLRGGLSDIRTDLLYSFISVPDSVDVFFLGLIDMNGRNIVLALLAGGTQFFQTKLSVPPLKAREGAASFKDDLARSFNLQMRYLLPLIVFGAAWSISAAIALYFTVSNIISIGQELYVRRTLKSEADTSKAS